MPDLKITEMTAATLPLLGDEDVAIVQGGGNRKAPARALRGNYPSGSISGWYIMPWGFGQNTPTGTLNANAVYGSLLEIVVPITIDEITVRSGTANTTGDQAAFAIYALSGSRPLPTGAPLWSSGTVTMAVPSTTFSVAVSPTLTLQPGLYFFAHNQNVSRAFFMRRGSQAQALVSRFTGGSTPGSGFFASGGGTLRKDSVTFGTWPTLTGAASDWTSAFELYENTAQLVLRGA